MHSYCICHYKVQFYIFGVSHLKDLKESRQSLCLLDPDRIFDPKIDDGSGSDLRSNFFGSSYSLLCLHMYAHCTYLAHTAWNNVNLNPRNQFPLQKNKKPECNCNSQRCFEWRIHKGNLTCCIYNPFLWCYTSIWIRRQYNNPDIPEWIDQSHFPWCL